MGNGTDEDCNSQVGGREMNIIILVQGDNPRLTINVEERQRVIDVVAEEDRIETARRNGYLRQQSSRLIAVG